MIEEKIYIQKQDVRFALQAEYDALFNDYLRGEPLALDKATAIQDFAKKYNFELNERTL